MRLAWLAAREATAVASVALPVAQKAMFAQPTVMQTSPSPQFNTVSEQSTSNSDAACATFRFGCCGPRTMSVGSTSPQIF